VKETKIAAFDDSRFDADDTVAGLQSSHSVDSKIPDVEHPLGRMA